MADNNLLLLLVVIAVVLFLYYAVFNGKLNGACSWCPSCGKKTANGSCPTCPSCPTNNRDAAKVLRQFARGCTHRLRGVVREDMISAVDVSDFMTNGSSRLVIITNVDPEKFIELVLSGDQTALQQLKAVAVSSAVVAGKKTYMVMSVANGRLSPIGAPTPLFVDAFNYLEKTAREQIGPDVNNLAFFIDEDIPCPEETTPLHEETGTPVKEGCCGRQY